MQYGSRAKYFGKFHYFQGISFSFSWQNNSFSVFVVDKTVLNVMLGKWLSAILVRPPGFDNFDLWSNAKTIVRLRDR